MKKKLCEANYERYLFIDYIRSFSIILMIIGHVGFSNALNKWISSFHMPVWFILAGYLHNPLYAYVDYVYRKIRTLIVPFLFYGILNAFWSLYEIGDLRLISFIWPNSNKLQFSIAGALWFLPAIFFAEVFSYRILSLKRGAFYCIVIGLFGSLLPVISIHLPFSIDSALVGIGFLGFGKLIGLHKDHLLSLNFFTTILILLFASVLVFVNSYVNMRSNTYGIIPLYWFNAVLMTIAFLNVFRCLELKMTEWSILTKLILFISHNSIVFLCFNQVVLFCARNIGHSNNRIIMLSYSLLKTIFVIAVCFLIAKVRRFILDSFNK